MKQEGRWKRDKEMKFAVDRLWQYYFAESAGKIRSNAEGCAGRRERAKELKLSGRSGG